MTDLSSVKARLPRLPLRTIIALTWRLKLARLFLWVARVTDTYDGVLMRDAHKRFRDGKRLNLEWTFEQCLSTAWRAAKDRRKATARGIAA